MKLNDHLIDISNGLDEIGRECFYALRKMETGDSTADAHVKRILDILGISKPEQLGLANSRFTMLR